MPGRNKLDSRHAVNAFVAATALGASPTVALTGDLDDLTYLIGEDPGVLILIVAVASYPTPTVSGTRDCRRRMRESTRERGSVRTRGGDVELPG
jgi:hypothetical protein